MTSQIPLLLKSKIILCKEKHELRGLNISNLIECWGLKDLLETYYELKKKNSGLYHHL